jgi:Spy/CpxP family protein refolding chaperone
MRRQFSDRMTQRLETSLDLTEEQKQKLGAVIREHFDAIRAIREGENRPLTRAEWRDRIDAATAQSERKLEEFLSPTQLSTYRELDEDERIGGGWGNRRPER